MAIKKIEVLFFLLIVSFFIASVSALRVSPASYTIDFEPNYEGTFAFNFQSGNLEEQLEILVFGSFEDYATVSPNVINGSGNVEVHLKLPSTANEPGGNILYVRANPVAPGGVGQVGAVASVAGIIRILVPYPGKYADLEFDVSDANTGENLNYKLKIYSRGEEDLVAFPEVELFDSENRSVGVFVLPSETVEAGNFIELNSNLDTSNYNPGTYRAVVKVSYSGQVKEMQDEFRIGDLVVDVVNYTQVVEKNKINPFFIDIRSSWNNPVRNVYAEVFVVGSDKSFLTPSITLSNFQDGKLEGYFDTNGIKADDVQLKVVLNYEGKTTEKIVSVGIVKGKFEINYLLVGAVAVIILLLVFFVWVVLKLKRLEKQGGKGKKK